MYAIWLSSLLLLLSVSCGCVSNVPHSRPMIKDNHKYASGKPHIIDIYSALAASHLGYKCINDRDVSSECISAPHYGIYTNAMYNTHSLSPHILLVSSPCRCPTCFANQSLQGLTHTGVRQLRRQHTNESSSATLWKSR